MKRKEFSRGVKLKAWDRCGGRCEKCGDRLRPDRIEYDHVIPSELCGKATLENCQVVCRLCHVKKTVDDIIAVAKSRRVRARHVGARTPKRPMPGGRNSPWKKKLSGEVVRR